MSQSFASLSPTLLARKGGAKPAMRSQLQLLNHCGGAVPPIPEDWSEDLGWNDMGEDAGASDARGGLGEVIPITAARPEPEEEPDESAADTLPEVVRQRVSLAQKLSDATKCRSALVEGRRRAFTLRIDADRHLRLRLAGVFGNRSGQDILTAALDRYLAEMPDLDRITQHARAKPRNILSED